MREKLGVFAEEYGKRIDWWCGPIDLNRNNVKFRLIEQMPGDVVITAPKVIHMVWSEVCSMASIFLIYL
jgi:hypothetical protein